MSSWFHQFFWIEHKSDSLPNCLLHDCEQWKNLEADRKTPLTRAIKRLILYCLWGFQQNVSFWSATSYLIPAMCESGCQALLSVTTTHHLQDVCYAIHTLHCSPVEGISLFWKAKQTPTALARKVQSLSRLLRHCVWNIILFVWSATE